MADIRKPVKTLDKSLSKLSRTGSRNVREEFADAIEQLSRENKPGDLKFALQQLVRDLRTPRPAARKTRR
ncbi:hypothetical protein EON79_10235 [bacterium]|nr:MAG: hypothetical protein EON79_10235 [bacterium]